MAVSAKEQTEIRGASFATLNSTLTALGRRPLSSRTPRDREIASALRAEIQNRYAQQGRGGDLGPRASRTPRAGSAAAARSAGS